MDVNKWEQFKQDKTILNEQDRLVVMTECKVTL